MAFYDKFPYTNFQELNLDWIISALKLLQKEQEEFINNNVIKYADPIQWNITSQYEANTVVTDVNGNAYISSKPVPDGVNITNTDYWSKIGNFDALWSTVKDGITTADEGAGTTATAARAVGDLVWVQDDLLRVTAPMIAGNSYVIGSNCEHTDIDDELKAIAARFADIVADLAAEATARQNADTALQNAITAEETARQNADTDLQTAITAEETARQNADTALQADINELASEIIAVKKKYYIFIGDSYSVQNNNQLITETASRLGITVNDYYISAEGSSGFAHQGLFGNTFNSLLNNAYAAMTPDERLKVTDIIFMGGANDTLHTDTEIQNAMEVCAGNCSTKFPDSRVSIAFLARLTDPSKINEAARVCALYSSAPAWSTWQYLRNLEYVLHDIDYMSGDGVHPNSAGYSTLAGYLAEALKTGSCNVHYAMAVAGSFPDTLSGAAADIYEELNNGIVTMYLNRGIEIMFTDNLPTLVGQGALGITLGTTNKKFIIGNYYETCGTAVPVSIYYNSGATLYQGTGFLYFYNGEIRLRVLASEGASYLTMANINVIRIGQATINFPTLNC